MQRPLSTESSDLRARVCPPRPRLVFRVGFAGRRELQANETNRLEQAVHELLGVIGHQLAVTAPGNPIGTPNESQVAEFYSAQCPLLRLVTGLCEGADAVAGRVLESVCIANEGKDGSRESSFPCLETELAAVLPFELDEYRKSRPPEFVDEFERQLSRCAWVLELDGKYEKPTQEELKQLPVEQRLPRKRLADSRRARGYRAQSAFLLRQSDLLIAAADPSNMGRAGGTLETVRAALDFGLPVVFVDTGKDGENVYMIGPDLDLQASLAAEPVPASDWQPELREWVVQLTADPDSGIELVADNSGSSLNHLTSLLTQYFDDPHTPPRPSNGPRTTTFRESCWSWFSSLFASGEKPKRDREIEPFNRYRTRATELNYHYAGLYRGAFILNYSLAILAVALAAFSLLLIGEASHTSLGGEVVKLVGAEVPTSEEVNEVSALKWLSPTLFVLGAFKLGIVIFISRNTRRANRELWNDRAIDYRYLAERLRCMFYLPVAGSNQPPAAAPPQFASRVLRQSTVDWLFDAIVRSVSPAQTETKALHDFSERDARTNPRMIRVDALGVVEQIRDEWIDNQAKYHSRNVRIMHGMHHWIEHISQWLNWSVVIVVALDLVLIGGKLLHLLPESMVPFAKIATPILIFISAILPAIVAALGGIRFQAECQRLAERSEVMRAILIGGGNRSRESVDEKEGRWKVADCLASHIETAQADRNTDLGAWSLDALRLCERVATDFVQEVAEWSVLYAKDVSDPG